MLRLHVSGSTIKRPFYCVIHLITASGGAIRFAHGAGGSLLYGEATCNRVDIKAFFILAPHSDGMERSDRPSDRAAIGIYIKRCELSSKLKHTALL